MIKRYCLAVLFIIILTSCSERNIIVDYDVESPLIANDISNQKVSSFAEDALGHIWIGTFRGLNRFNVHEFHQHFCTDEANTLPDNQIQCLFKDSQNRLWISTVNGMALYTDQDSFERIPMETVSRNSIQIFEDKSGRVFINTSISLCVFDEERRVFTDVLHLLDNSYSITRQCFITPGGDLIVAGSSNLKKYDVRTMELKDSVSLQNYPGYFTMMDDGRLWMSSYSGLSIYDTDKSKFDELPQVISSHPMMGGAAVSYISVRRFVHPLQYGKERAVPV